MALPGKRVIMRTPIVSCLLLIFLAFTFSCEKEYSNEGNLKQGNIDSLPANYPFSSGFCATVTLGVAVAELNNYTPDTSVALAPSVLLDMPAAGDQGSQSSCSAWAVAYGLGSYYTHAATGKAYSDTGNLSPKYTYNQIAKGNCGCTSLVDNLYLLREQGAASLNSMPYDPRECLIQPNTAQKNNAANTRIQGFLRVDLFNMTLIKHTLANNKPIVFAIPVDAGFLKLPSPYIWSSHTGTTGEEHAMVIVGYDDTKNSLRVLNSWSTAWADDGGAWIDYNFFLSNTLQDGFVVY